MHGLKLHKYQAYLWPLSWNEGSRCHSKVQTFKLWVHQSNLQLWEVDQTQFFPYLKSWIFTNFAPDARLIGTLEKNCWQISPICYSIGIWEKAQLQESPYIVEQKEFEKGLPSQWKQYKTRRDKPNIFRKWMT